MPREVTAKARKAPQPAEEKVGGTKARRTTAGPSGDGGLDREGLATALGKLRPALRSGGTIKELEHIWLDDKYISAYDGGLGIRLTYSTGVSCGAPGRALLGLLGTSALKEVALEMDGDSTLVVKLGRSRTKLNVLAPDRDPWQFPLEHGASHALSEAAVEALRSVLIVKPRENRLEHHGVAVYADKKGVDFYATDGATIVQATLDGNDAKLPAFTFIPRPLADQIVALCPHGASLAIADDHLAALGRGVELCTNAMDTSGIADIPALVDKQLEAHAESVALPAGLEAVLDRAEVLAGADAEIKLSVRGKDLTLTGKYPLGELREELALESKHPNVDMGVVASRLRRGLLAADRFSVSKDTMVFYGGETFLYMVAARG